MMSILGNIDTQIFLDEYWQQKPLLIRGALPNLQPPMTPEEMAGFALEDNINARLVVEKPRWQVKYNPFEENDFTSLPESGYSLLLMDLEKHIPWFDLLRQQFRFIPDWRFDDIMMSYAPEGGSVGAHIDQYDVFLLQGSGSRHWSIETTPQTNPQWLEDCPLRILKDFNPDQDWTLEAGDMLYLPPGLAHHGVAGENCTTISVGFRAWSHAEIISHITDSLSDTWETQYFRDNALNANKHPALIDDNTITHFRDILNRALSLDDATLKHHIGNLLTERRSDLTPLFPEHVEITEQAVLTLLQQGKTLDRNLASKFAYSVLEDGVLLHADGASIMCSLQTQPLVEYLCDYSEYAPEVLLQYEPEELLPIVRSLILRGCIG